MAIRNVVQKGDAVLSKKCRKVEKFDDRLAQIIEDMKETLRYVTGCGLAAPQIGISERYLVIDLGEEKGMIEIINPEILEQSGKQEEIEGCLSCPDELGITVRPKKVKIKAQNIKGEYFTMEEEGLIARAFCHEIDHLDGILFTEKVVKKVTIEDLQEMENSKKDSTELQYIRKLLCR